MVHKVTLSECLLEILTSFRLKTACICHIAGWLLRRASAWASGCYIFVICLTSLLLAHDQVVSINLPSFRWLHQFVSLGSCRLGLFSSWAKLSLKVIERSLPIVLRVLSEQRLYGWGHVLTVVVAIGLRAVCRLGIKWLFAFCWVHLVWFTHLVYSTYLFGLIVKGQL